MVNLKGKTDKKIKRYLKSVAEDYKESKIYNSIHYLVVIEGKVKDIRFSDHLSPRSNPFINIIKCTDTIYQVWYNNGDKQTCNSDDIVDYIKSYILMYDKFAEYNQLLRDQVTTIEKELQKVSKSELYKNLQSYKDRLHDKCQEIADLTNKLNSSTAKIERLNNQINSFRKIKEQMNSFRKYIINNSPKFEQCDPSRV